MRLSTRGAGRRAHDGRRPAVQDMPAYAAREDVPREGQSNEAPRQRRREVRTFPGASVGARAVQNIRPPRSVSRRTGVSDGVCEDRLQESSHIRRSARRRDARGGGSHIRRPGRETGTPLATQEALYVTSTTRRQACNVSSSERVALGGATSLTVGVRLPAALCRETGHIRSAAGCRGVAPRHRRAGGPRAWESIPHEGAPALMRGGETVTRCAHNAETPGSIPGPAISLHRPGSLPGVERGSLAFTRATEATPRNRDSLHGPHLHRSGASGLCGRSTGPRPSGHFIAGSVEGSAGSPTATRPAHGTARRKPVAIARDSRPASHHGGGLRPHGSGTRAATGAGRLHLRARSA